MKKIIIAVTGPQESGRKTFAEYCMRKYGLIQLSRNRFLKNLLEKKKLPVNDFYLKQITDEILKDNGENFIARELLKIAEASRFPYVIGPVESFAEAKFLTEQGVTLIGIDSLPLTRHRRLFTGKAYKKETFVSYPDFLRQEGVGRKSYEPEPEIETCLKRVKFLIENDSTIESFYGRIDALMKILLKE